MKKIIRESPDTIHINELQDPIIKDKIIGYKTGGGMWAILIEIPDKSAHRKYGFIYLNKLFHSRNINTFESDKAYTSIYTAVHANKELFIFNDYEEFIHTVSADFREKSPNKVDYP